MAAHVLTGPVLTGPLLPVPVLIGTVLAVPVLLLPALTARPAMAAGPARPPSAASATAARSSPERFTLTGHQADGSRQQARAAGVLSASGSAQVTKVMAGRTVTRLVFGRGSVRLVTYAKRRSVSVPSPSTCKFTEVVHGDYAVRGGGQRYQHATGSGVYITRIVGHLTKRAAAAADRSWPGSGSAPEPGARSAGRPSR